MVRIIHGARTRHIHGIRNTCARQIRGVVVGAVVDEMRRAPWILKQVLELALAHLLLLSPPRREEEARQSLHMFVDILVADDHDRLFLQVDSSVDVGLRHHGVRLAYACGLRR
jgi:hypothetical protein